MNSSNWQKQNIHMIEWVWGLSAAIAILLFLILFSLGFSVQTAGVLFIVVFVLLRIGLAYLLNNRFANSMVRILKFEPEEIERDFRLVFKDKFIRYQRKMDEDEARYSYVFPGRHLTMLVEPHWTSIELDRPPATKVTLRLVNPKNREFAEMLAAAIDEMVVARGEILEPVS